MSYTRAKDLNISFNIPIYNSYLKEIEEEYEKIIEKVYGDRLHKMGDVRSVEKFIRNYITDQFETTEEKKEARCFTIALLAVAEFISMDLVEKLTNSENEDLYIKMGITYLCNHRIESTGNIESFEDLCDTHVVKKVFNIMSEIEDFVSDDAYDTTKLMIDQLPEEVVELNPKNLPSVIEQPYNSINPGQSQTGKIARNEWYKLDKEFGEILEGLNYTFFKLDGGEGINMKTTVLRIFDAANIMILADRIVDTGSILGLGTSLEIPVYIDGRYDSIYCSVSNHPEICRASLINPQTPIDNKYIPEIFADMLPDSRIYFYIDFSETSIKDLNNTEKKKLSKNMSKIFDTFFNNNSPIYRMTLTEFASPNKFELLSDQETVVHRDSCQQIAPVPTLVKFDNGKIEVIQNEKSIDFSDDAAMNGSVYGPFMSGLFSHLIIR